ncbi:hypothetical protein Tco_0736713 [Tanacetum coccineum]
MFALDTESLQFQSLRLSNGRITIRRDDDKLYTFKEGDYKRLCLQDIEDMLLLLVQGKLKNLTIKERLALSVSLSDLKQKTAYTAYSNPRGFIYQNKDKKNKLMRIDELHKFSDGTLNDVRSALNDILKRIRMEYLLQTVDPHRFKGYLKMEVKHMSLPGYGVLIFISSWLQVKSRHKYDVSSLMDTAYRMSEQLTVVARVEVDEVESVSEISPFQQPYSEIFLSLFAFMNMRISTFEPCGGSLSTLLVQESNNFPVGIHLRPTDLKILPVGFHLRSDLGDVFSEQRKILVNPTLTNDFRILLSMRLSCSKIWHQHSIVPSAIGSSLISMGHDICLSASVSFPDLSYHSCTVSIVLVNSIQQS